MATRRRSASVAGNRAVIYIRVSTLKQVESGLGLGDQRERLEAYCKLRGLEVVEVVVDDGESAGKPLVKRPGGSKVLELVRTKAVDAVVVLKLDRAFRNAKDCLNVVDDWDRVGVTLHITDMGGQSVDTQSAMGRMFFFMAAGFAEMERRLVEERTTAALTHKARSGNMRLGADAPYGWRYDGNALAPVEAEQTVLTAVRVSREDGDSLRGTCALLKAAGHRNRAGGEFMPTQIERMLRGSVRQSVTTLPNSGGGDTEARPAW